MRVWSLNSEQCLSYHSQEDLPRIAQSLFEQTIEVTMDVDSLAVSPVEFAMASMIICSLRYSSLDGAMNNAWAVLPTGSSSIGQFKDIRLIPASNRPYPPSNGLPLWWADSQGQHGSIHHFSDITFQRQRAAGS